MNIINVESLINKSDRNNGIFIEILKKCHAQINRYSTQHKATECIFTVPAHIFGKPVYKYADLISFLLEELSKNGLFARYSDNNIFISWDKKYINYENYVLARDAGRQDKINVPQNIDKYRNAQRVQQERDKFFKSLCSKK